MWSFSAPRSSPATRIGRERVESANEPLPFSAHRDPCVFSRRLDGGHGPLRRIWLFPDRGAALDVCETELPSQCRGTRQKQSELECYRLISCKATRCGTAGRCASGRRPKPLDRSGEIPKLAHSAARPTRQVTLRWGCSSAGRASGWQSEGLGVRSPTPPPKYFSQRSAIRRIPICSEGLGGLAASLYQARR